MYLFVCTLIYYTIIHNIEENLIKPNLFYKIQQAILVVGKKEGQKKY